VSVLGAGTRNEAKALRMDLLHVVPPFRLLVDLGEIRVQAVLSQVFRNYVLSSDAIEVILHVIRSAVFTIREALFVFEFLCASWAAPCDKSRLDLNISSQLVRILIKLFDEVKGSLVV